MKNNLIIENQLYHFKNNINKIYNKKKFKKNTTNNKIFLIIFQHQLIKIQIIFIIYNNNHRKVHIIQEIIEEDIEEVIEEDIEEDMEEDIIIILVDTIKLNMLKKNNEIY